MATEEEMVVDEVQNERPPTPPPQVEKKSSNNITEVTKKPSKKTAKFQSTGVLKAYMIAAAKEEESLRNRLKRRQSRMRVPSRTKKPQQIKPIRNGNRAVFRRPITIKHKRGRPKRK